MVELDMSRTAGRKRRLAKSLTRWHRSVLHSWRQPDDRRARQIGARRAAWLKHHRGSEPAPWWPVATVLLTANGTPAEAYGKVRQFWMQLRDRWGTLTYAWWLELTKEGEVHVHAMLVNPPRAFWKHSTHDWLEKQWGGRYVKLRGMSGSWFRRDGAAYALAYAKKMGAKAYQQDYEQVPSFVRTVGTSLREHTVSELHAHEDQVDAGWRASAYDIGSRKVCASQLEIVTTYRHEGDVCSLAYVTKSASDQRRSARVAQRLATLSHSARCSAPAPGVMQAGAQRTPRRQADTLSPSAAKRSADSVLGEGLDRAGHPLHTRSRASLEYNTKPVAPLDSSRQRYGFPGDLWLPDPS